VKSKLFMSCVVYHNQDTTKVSFLVPLGTVVLKIMAKLFYYNYAKKP